MATKATRAQRITASVFMPGIVPSGGTGFKRRPAALPSVRLAQVYEVAKAKTAAALYALSCERVALGNEVYLDAGQADVVTEHMAVIDASMLPRPAVDLLTALHEAEMADCFEQIPDETFREKLRRGVATVEQGREWVRKSAMARYKSEQAEQSVVGWIKQQVPA